MTQLVLTLDKNVLHKTETGIKRFVAKTENIRGLVEDEFGVKVTILSGDGKLIVCYVEESFDEISSTMIYGGFDPEMD